MLIFFPPHTSLTARDTLHAMAHDTPQPHFPSSTLSFIHKKSVDYQHPLGSMDLPGDFVVEWYGKA